MYGREWPDGNGGSKMLEEISIVEHVKVGRGFVVVVVVVDGWAGSRGWGLYIKSTGFGE